MSRPVQRLYFEITDQAELETFLRELNTKIEICFGKTTEEFPYTDHGCIVELHADSNLYAYTVEGHGIGSNKKDPADLKDTVRRIFADCQRFRGGDTVTVIDEQYS